MKVAGSHYLSQFLMDYLTIFTSGWRKTTPGRNDGKPNDQIYGSPTNRYIAVVRSISSMIFWPCFIINRLAVFLVSICHSSSFPPNFIQPLPDCGQESEYCINEILKKNREREIERLTTTAPTRIGLTATHSRASGGASEAADAKSGARSSAINAAAMANRIEPVGA